MTGLRAYLQTNTRFRKTSDQEPIHPSLQHEAEGDTTPGDKMTYWDLAKSGVFRQLGMIDFRECPSRTCLTDSQQSLLLQRIDVHGGSLFFSCANGSRLPGNSRQVSEVWVLV
jgi:hypothetical protein